MSSFYTLVGIGDPTAGRFQEVAALVDTGATWTWVPRDVLEQLGHRPTIKRQFRTADNRVIERDATEVPIRLGNEVLRNLCVFGDEGSVPLLGATTMETFSVAPDPVNERLVPVVGLLMSLFDDD